jgi:hypothetical protein
MDEEKEIAVAVVAGETFGDGGKPAPADGTISFDVGYGKSWEALFEAEDALRRRFEEETAQKNENPRTTDIAELRREFVANPTWAKELFDGYMAERYYHRTGVNISALEWAHMRVKGLCIEVDRLRAYRKNARKSMRQMQAALERKNREIAELRNDAVGHVLKILAGRR